MKIDLPRYRSHFQRQRPADTKSGATRREPEFHLLLEHKKQRKSR